MKKSYKILSVLLILVICLAFVACDQNTGNNGDDPVVNPGDDPVVNPGDDPVVNPGDDPVVDPGDDPVVDPGDDPVVDPGDEPIIDNSKYYDEITSTLTLTKSFEGKSFLTDGIGRATLIAHTDGDTSRFRLEQGNITVSIRYFQIDTPESTGNVEKWGKAASLFVKERLTNATEIVLEATKDKAVKDSYGTRYLGYVWYKTAEDTEFKLLNLEVVENGFSDNKGIPSSEYPYYEYFARANNFARKNSLRIYSNEDDPLYSTDPEDITLKDFWDNTEAYYNAETDAGSKVRFSACLVDIKVSNSGTHTFVAEWYDEEGKRYTINVYAGYTSAPASQMMLGHVYRVVGSIQYYGGQYQVSGIIYNEIFGANRMDYTHPTQYNYFLNFDSNAKFISQYGDMLHGDVTVVSATLDGTVLTIVGTSQLRTKNGFASEIKTYTFKVNVGENFNNTWKAGDKFSTSGYQYVENSGEITVLNYSNIVKR